MLFEEIIPIYTENHTNRKIFYGQNMHLIFVEAGSGEKTLIPTEKHKSPIRC
jgi:hypothetical protein